MDKIGEIKILSTYRAKTNPTSQKRTYAKCICRCGKEFTTTISNIKTGTTQSCGCHRKSLKTSLIHGLSRTKEHRAWLAMINRCTNPNATSYKHYGARGITVCDRWLNSFTDFLSDIGFAPSKGHSIDRKNNNLGYSPENCFWATIVEQQNNKRSNRFFEYNGESKSIIQWSEITNMPCGTIRSRIDRGWPIKEALTLPIGFKFFGNSKVEVVR